MVQAGFQYADSLVRPDRSTKFHFNPHYFPEHYTAGLRSREEIIADPSFRLLAAQPGETPDHVEIRCSYDRREAGAPPQKATVVAVFDRNARWLPVAYEEEYQSTNGSRFTSSHRYQSEFSGKCPSHYRREAELKVQRQGKSSVWHDRMVSDVSLHYGPVPEREFTLSAFGFPEPAELQRKSWLADVPRWFWLTLCGIGMIVTAVWLRQRREARRD